MSKFTFVCQEEAMPFADVVSSKRTVEFSADTLNQIMDEFQNFLRGCGFYFDGQLDFVSDEEIVYQSKEVDFDFSNIPQNNWPFQNEQIKPLTVADLERMKMPGTLGGAEITFASDK